MNMAHIKYSVSAIALFVMAVEAGAVQSPETGTVKGQEPTVNNIVITNVTNPGIGLRAGDKAAFSYDFSDPDGDTEVLPPGRQWMIAGVDVAGAIGATYTTTGTDGGKNLKIRITPKTSSTITDPAVGTPVTSVAFKVANASAPVDIDQFIAPSAAGSDYSAAAAFCAAKGMQLPTSSELQNLYINRTSATVAYPTGGWASNTELCDIYKWPIGSGACGGATHYWSRTPALAGQHKVVSLVYGESVATADTSPNFMVTCVP